MRVLSYVLAVLLGGIAMYVLLHLGTVSGPSFLQNAKKFPDLEMSYSDFLTVMFSAATLVLAGVALIVGIVAIFTYQGIKLEARNAIQDETDERMKQVDAQISKEIEEQAAELLKKAGRGGEFDKALQSALMAINQGAAELDGELEEPINDGDR